MSSHPAVASAPPPSTPSPAEVSPTRPHRTGPLVWLALGVLYLIWGSTYLGIRVVAQYLPAFGPAALRFGVAGIALAGILAAVRGARVLRVPLRQLGAVALVGTLLIAGGNGLVVLAESPRFGLPSGLAALLIALNPLVMVVLRLAVRDAPRPLSLIGVLVGLAGLVLLFLPGTGVRAVPMVGGVLALLATLCWCVGSFATRWLPMPANPFVASVYEMLAGAAAMTLLAIGHREPAPWTVPGVPLRAWLALVYLCLAGSIVAFTAYAYLLHTAPISLTTTYAYVNPVIALILGAVVLGEALSGRVLLAAGTVVLGVILVVSVEARSTRTA
jgi:drug/metabolite transporter (DMT)-like permease